MDCSSLFRGERRTTTGFSILLFPAGFELGCIKKNLNYSRGGGKTLLFIVIGSNTDFDHGLLPFRKFRDSSSGISLRLSFKNFAL